MSSMPLLQLDVLKTLVAGVQAGGFARAAERIGRTQSAVSLQMKKLEEQLDTPLFEKQGRSLALTPAGETLYHYALRMLELNAETVSAVRGAGVSGAVRLGMSMDYEHTVLPAVLARFARAHPQIALDIHMDRNAVLKAKVRRQELDLAVLFANDAGEPVTHTTMAWIAHPDYRVDPDVELPLLLLDEPCVFRKSALQALDAAGLRWRIAVTSPGLSGLWAAARAGLGVTVRTAFIVPAGLADIGPESGLPALPDIGVCLMRGSRKANPPVDLMRETITGVLAEQRGR